MGVPNLGGSVTTRSGLFFIGASQDNYLRAYDTKSGRELWRVRLPAGGQANPSTYYSTSSGRQFLVISAGGHGGLATTPGDWVMAYALPRSGK
jgi:quinoprotein glucose dehydrogenase